MASPMKPTTDEAILQVRGLTVRFGSLVAVDGVGFDAQPYFGGVVVAWQPVNGKAPFTFERGTPRFEMPFEGVEVLGELLGFSR